MPAQEPLVNRTLVAAITVTLFVAGFALHVIPATSGESFALWRGACVRVGIVMAAVWLALPSKDRPAAWSNVKHIGPIAALMAALVFFRVQLRVLLPMALALFVLGVVLRPREPTRPQRDFQ